MYIDGRRLLIVEQAVGWCDGFINTLKLKLKQESKIIRRIFRALRNMKVPPYENSGQARSWRIMKISKRLRSTFYPV